MIKVTKLNGKGYHLNAIYIEAVESSPDTMITLTNGKKFIVRESEEDVLRNIEKFYTNIRILGCKELTGGTHEE